MIAIIFAILLIPPRTAFARKPALDTSIRVVNWDSLLVHDTLHFQILNDAFDDPAFDSAYGPYYRILHDSEAGGYFSPTVSSNTYIDLNRDGKEDVIVTLFEVGSGEYGTQIMFLQTNHGPKFSGYFSGARFSDTMINDTLFIESAHWLEEDAECCQSAYDYQRMIAMGDTIRFLPLLVKPNAGTASSVVYDFYSALAGNYMPDSLTPRQYAYSLLSKSYQASHPYAKWSAAFQHTFSIKTKVDGNSPDSLVRVQVTSTDTINGHTVTKHYSGVWHMKFVTNNLPYADPKAIAKWVLDWPEIRRVQ